MMFDRLTKSFGPNGHRDGAGGNGKKAPKLHTNIHRSDYKKETEAAGGQHKRKEKARHKTST